MATHIHIHTNDRTKDDYKPSDPVYPRAIQEVADRASDCLRMAKAGKYTVGQATAAMKLLNAARDALLHG